MTSPKQSSQGLVTLEKYLKTMRIGKIVLLTVLPLMLVGMSVFLINQPNTPQERMVPLLLGLGCMLVVILLVVRFTFGVVVKRVQQAIELLSTTPARPMQVLITRIADFNGQLALLWPENTSTETQPWGVAAVRTTHKNTRPPKGTVPVNMHAMETSLDRKIVLDLGSAVYWGALTTSEDRRKNWGRMKLLMGALSLLGVVMIIVAMLVGQKMMDNLQQELSLAQASLNWPATEARIVTNAMKNVRISRGKSSVPGFEAKISFSYQVGGRKYTSSIIHFGYEASESREEVENFLKQYPPGVSAQIAYNPQAPDMGVLEAGHTQECEQALSKAKRAQIFIALACALLVIMPFGMYVILNWRRKHLMREHGLLNE